MHPCDDEISIAIGRAHALATAGRRAMADRERRGRVFRWAFAHAVATPMLRLSRNYVRLDKAFQPGALSRDLASAKASAIGGVLTALDGATPSSLPAANSAMDDVSCSVSDTFLVHSSQDERWAMLSGGALGFLTLVLAMILLAMFIAGHDGTTSLAATIGFGVVDAGFARHARRGHPDLDMAYPGVDTEGVPGSMRLSTRSGHGA